MLLEEKVWHYEMRVRDQLRIAKPPSQPVTLTSVTARDSGMWGELFHAIGRPYFWSSQRDWTPKEWRAWLNRESRHAWVVEIGGRRAGMVEIAAHPGGDVEIDLFGLLPEFVARGFGGPALVLGTQRAWELGPGPVWLHTTSFDNPRARLNFERRGFVLTKIETRNREIPDDDVPASRLWSIKDSLGK